MSELVEYLSEQSAPRKHELMNMKSELRKLEAQISSGKPERRSNFLSRVAPVTAYAHWEGFIKSASLAFISYACRKSRPLSNYSTAFQAMACRSAFVEAGNASRQIAFQIHLVNLLTERIEETHKFSGQIDTESNLTWSVFCNICSTIGVDWIVSDEFWSANALLVGGLVEVRCAIAHGETLPVSIKDGIRYIDFAIDAIDKYSEAIVSSANGELYLRESYRSSFE